jgi:hypothetical protein
MQEVELRRVAAACDTVVRAAIEVIVCRQAPLSGRSFGNTPSIRELAFRKESAKDCPCDAFVKTMPLEDPTCHVEAMTRQKVAQLAEASNREEIAVPLSEPSQPGQESLGLAGKVCASAEVHVGKVMCPETCVMLEECRKAGCISPWK